MRSGAVVGLKQLIKYADAVIKEADKVCRAQACKGSTAVTGFTEFTDKASHQSKCATALLRM